MSWLKEWKPIHLCWLFRKFGLPIPPYFIGGAAQQHQDHYRILDDDNADPDLCTPLANSDTPKADMAKSTKFMVRIQVHDDIADSAAAVWNLYVNTVDNSATATQVTTISTPAQLADGTPADGAATDDNDLVDDANANHGYTWVNGEYTESDDSDKVALAIDEYTDFQWCVQIIGGNDSQDYYFYARRAGAELDSHSNVAQITTPAAAGNAPTSVFEGPLRGPLGGPIQ